MSSCELLEVGAEESEEAAASQRLLVRRTAHVGAEVYVVGVRVQQPGEQPQRREQRGIEIELREVAGDARVVHAAERRLPRPGGTMRVDVAAGDPRLLEVVCGVRGEVDEIQPWQSARLPRLPVEHDDPL